jgi:hypothetical protein
VRPLILTPATGGILAFIRRTEFPLSVHGRSAARVEPLAAALELCVRKWANLGLVPELLQQILCDCHQKFHACGHQLPRRKPLVSKKKPGPKLRRMRKKTYAEALSKGRVSRSLTATIEDQSARHTKGIAQNKEISRRLALLLASRKIPGLEFIRYNAFAQKLGRLSRTYADKSLQMAAANLIDLYEAKSLDGDTLRAIAVALFGVNVSP